MSYAGDAMREAADADRGTRMRDAAGTPDRVSCVRCGEFWASHDAIPPYKGRSCKAFVTPTPSPFPTALPPDADGILDLIATHFQPRGGGRA